MNQHEVWRQFATAALNAMMINRQLPMRLEEDFHFIENASAVCAKFADEMTEQWKKRQPKLKQKRKAA